MSLMVNYLNIQANDPSLWGNGCAGQLSIGAALKEGNCNPL